MKRHFLSLIFAIMALCPLSLCAQSTDTLFPYPQAPDDKPTLSEKCNYLVYNFWNRCNIKNSFSSLSRLNEAFGTWAGFMPYATADTVHMAIDNYIKTIEKQSPKNMADVGRMAQNWFYCDTAEYRSEELYLPFCRAVANCKKVPKAERARYEAQLKILESSALGQNVPDFTFVKPDGSTGNFGDIRASRVVLFFNDPDCLDCSLAKARLSADLNTNQLIERGLIKIVSIYPGEATDEWCKEAERYPENWVVGASESIYDMFELPDMPDFYWLDGRHKVLGKNFTIDELLLQLQLINRN